MLEPFKRTKILATIGPATASFEKITQLIEAGVNGFRLNFSHAKYEESAQIVAWIRKASQELGRPVAILQDLQGPKIRFGELEGNHLDVKRGEEYVLEFGAEQRDKVLPVQYNLAEKTKAGEPIYLFDGKIKATVVEIPSQTAIKIQVENDGFLMSRKAINLPDTDFGGDILTTKDIEDIEFGASQDFDYVSLSFVQSEQDIHDLRQLLVSHGSIAHVIAKIETKAAIHPDTLEAIVRASDGVMVARGDLAVETGPEIVPVVQRKIIELCRQHGKLSIVATQMLASMVDAPEPTRAEVSDIATAVTQGADVVMLSDETANGSYPLEAVGAMRRTILYTQEHIEVDVLTRSHIDGEHEQRNAIARAAVDLAEQLGVKAIIAETKYGGTAESIASWRPSLPIISVTSEPRVAQQIALCYASRSFVRPDGETAGLNLTKELAQQGYFGADRPFSVVIVSGRQPGLSGGTDTIRVRMIE